MGTVTNARSVKTKSKPAYGFLRQISIHKSLYIMLIPAVSYFIIFKYIPILGSVIAFQDYNVYKGFLHSEWVWFDNFIQLFASVNFFRILSNNLIISLYQIVFSFPAPIILALLLNEVSNMKFKRSIQTMVYLPHFLSWPIIVGLIYFLLSSQTGIVNGILIRVGMIDEAIPFLQKAIYVRGLIVLSGIWKEMGWGAIIYLSTLTSISPSLYESATIDGAGRLKQCLYITIPGILPAVSTLLLLRIGNIMDLGFEQIYPFINGITMSKADVFDTYTYRAGILEGQYDISAAIGMFKSVVGCILLLIANKASKLTGGEGII